MSKNDLMQRFLLSVLTLVLLAAAGCAALDYTGYRVEATPGESRVYVMGAADSADTIVMGRHFVVPINGRNADLAAMRQSSRNCLTMRQLILDHHRLQ